MILSVTLNPSIDLALFVPKLELHDTNRVERIERDSGGKGLNLSRIVRELGVPTRAIAILGGHTGDWIERHLTELGLELDIIRSKADTRTNVSIESADGEPPTTLNARGISLSFDAELVVRERILNAPHPTWLALCGSAPQGTDPEIYAKLGKCAREHEVRVLVDADGELMKHAMAFGPDLIKPNQSEAERLVGQSLESKDGVRKAAQELRQRQIDAGANDPMAIISLGADGAILATSQGTFLGKSPQIHSVSSIGAGDSLLGGFLALLNRGDAPEMALKWGLASGAATATTDGTRIACRQNIEALLENAIVERLD